MAAGRNTIGRDRSSRCSGYGPSRDDGRGRRADHGDYLLVGIATGLIMGVILADGH
jgi:hypothetical protein